MLICLFVICLVFACYNVEMLKIVGFPIVILRSCKWRFLPFFLSSFLIHCVDIWWMYMLAKFWRIGAMIGVLERNIVERIWKGFTNVSLESTLCLFVFLGSTRLLAGLLPSYACSSMSEISRNISAELILPEKLQTHTIVWRHCKASRLTVDSS